MERHFDSELNDLKEQILAMGGYVEKAVDEAIRGLIERQPERFKEVYRLEKTINQFHMTVDETCLRVLARQAPLAKDLRLVVAAIKINTDLERMGDQAVNIAHNAGHYLEGPPLKPLVDIPKMAQEVGKMIQEALDAFVRKDIELAKQVLLRDDSVDAFKASILAELIELMERDPKAVARGINLILIARNLERLGDHATNIAEDVIFVSTGEDVRHGGKGSLRVASSG